MGTPIAGPATCTLPQAVAWAGERGATDEFVEDVIPALWLEAARHGLDPSVVIAQSAHETGFGRFGRAVTPGHHNTCGLKVADPSAYPDDAAAAHAQFASWQAGARAHCQHLAAYAGLPIPDVLELTARAPLVRAANAAHGRCLDVEDLGGRWAPASSYGRTVASKARDLAGHR